MTDSTSKCPAFVNFTPNHIQNEVFFLFARVRLCVDEDYSASTHVTFTSQNRYTKSMGAPDVPTHVKFPIKAHINDGEI